MRAFLSRCVFLLVTGISFFYTAYGDVIITKDGEELEGKIISVDDAAVIYHPLDAPNDSTVMVRCRSIFMIKYDDGRKEVIAKDRKSVPDNQVDEGMPFSTAVVCNTGLFGLININEEKADFGVFIIGVTPSIERRVHRYLSVGGEYMLLWADVKNASESRFIMNANAYGKLFFPLSKRCLFTTQIGAGLSYWPASDATYPREATFFEERIGWDFHGGIGIEYAFCKRGSICLFTGYNANFTTLDDIPVTIDMLSISAGPVFRF